MPDRSAQPRSWLFAPGHDEKLLSKVFDCGADAVLLDLEDAVPADLKDRARAQVAEVARARPCWVRVNKPRTRQGELDVKALAQSAAGLRLPKVESAADAEWAGSLAPGVPLDCTIESALGVVRAYEIACAPACTYLSYGGVDLIRDVGIADGEMQTLYARSAIVMAARAAGKPAPSDGVHTRLDDDTGLEREAQSARRLGYFGKSAIHPRQVPIINAVFSPTAAEREWAERVLAAFSASGGAATRLADGEFVDLAVAERARGLLGD